MIITCNRGLNVNSKSQILSWQKIRCITNLNPTMLIKRPENHSCNQKISEEKIPKVSSIPCGECNNKNS